MDENNRKPRRDAIATLILVLTGVIAFYIVAATLLVIIIELNDPSADTSGIVGSLSAMITGILGALLGLIAGRSDLK
jgi:energy-converting hydrogenase Eha subunit A